MHGKQDSSFFRHCNGNHKKSICTDLTYESAQIKLFSGLLARNVQVKYNETHSVPLVPFPSYAVVATVLVTAQVNR